MNSIIAESFKPAFFIFIVSYSITGLTASGQPIPTSPASGVSLFSMLQVLFGLAIVLAAIAGSAWILRRLAPGQTGAAGAIKIVGGVMVGPKERVVIVEITDTWLLLGVGQGQVSVLHTMPKMERATTDSMPVEGNFAERIRQAIQRYRT